MKHYSRTSITGNVIYKLLYILRTSASTLISSTYYSLLNIILKFLRGTTYSGNNIPWVWITGFEPAHLSIIEPKSIVSSYSTISTNDSLTWSSTSYDPRVSASTQVHLNHLPKSYWTKFNTVSYSHWQVTPCCHTISDISYLSEKCG